MPSTVHTSVKVVLWPNCPAFGTTCFGGADAHGRKVNPASTYAVLTLLLLTTVAHPRDTPLCIILTIPAYARLPARSPARPPARSRARCTCMITYTPAHTVTHAHARAATDWQVGDRLQLVDAGSQGIGSLTQNQLPHLDKTALLSGAGYITFNYGSSSAECNRCTVTNGAWCNNPAGVSPEGADDFYSCPYGNPCGTVSNILVPAHVNHACLCACGCVFPLVRIRC